MAEPKDVAVTYEHAFEMINQRKNYTTGWDRETFVKMRMISVVDPVAWHTENQFVVSKEWEWERRLYGGIVG